MTPIEPAASTEPVASALTAASAEALHGEIVSLKEVVGRGLFAFGRALARMHDTRGYGALGFPTFEAYLASEAVNVHRTYAYRLIERYKAFGDVEHALHGLDGVKLDILTRLIEPGDDPEAKVALVTQARALNRSETRQAVRTAVDAREADPDHALPVELPPPPPPVAARRVTVVVPEPVEAERRRLGYAVADRRYDTGAGRS